MGNRDEQLRPYPKIIRAEAVRRLRAKNNKFAGDITERNGGVFISADLLFAIDEEVIGMDEEQDRIGRIANGNKAIKVQIENRTDEAGNPLRGRPLTRPRGI